MPELTDEQRIAVRKLFRDRHIRKYGDIFATGTEARATPSPKRKRRRFKHRLSVRSKQRMVFVNRVKAKLGCADCGITDTRALDFHHLGAKSFSISAGVMAGLSTRLLKEEIKKCVVLCANHHRIQHAIERKEKKDKGVAR